MKNILDRTAFEEAFMNMMSNPKYVKYSFYSFIIAKMQVQMSKEVPTAGAGFINNNFQLVINPDFFNTLPLEQRMGILIHEADHIILQHIFRKGERDHRLFNIAADIALNQSINKEWLPKGAMYPETFKTPDGKTYPKGETAEFYYKLLKEEKERQEKEKAEAQGDQTQGEQGEDDQSQEQNGQGKGQEEKEQGSGWKPSNGNPDLTGSDEMTIDSHNLWEDIKPEDEELAKEIMTKNLEEAFEKARGNVPNNIEKMMDLWRKKAKLSWKKILKRYLSSKKGDRVSTIKKRNRRVRKLGVKGNKVAYDTPEVVVLLDISGSMSDEDIVTGLAEINEVCKISNSTMKIIQIDTEIKGLEEYDPKKKKFMRKGAGGTYLAPAYKYLVDNKIPFDVAMVITDGYIEDVSTDTIWSTANKPVIFLTTTGEMTPVGKNQVVYNIKDA